MPSSPLRVFGPAAALPAEDQIQPPTATEVIMRLLEDREGVAPVWV